MFIYVFSVLKTASSILNELTALRSIICGDSWLHSAKLKQSWLSPRLHNYFVTERTLNSW